MTTALDTFARRLAALGRAAPGPGLGHRAAVLYADFSWCRGAGRPAGPGGRDRSPVLDGPADRAASDARDCHLEDRDDVHWPTLTHPGSVVWPVVVHLGTAVGATGADRLRAAATGYAAVAATARALGPAHTRDYHSTATAGTVGSAAAAAVLLDLDEAGWVNTLGHAFSVLGGARGALLERSGTRAFHRAHAVRTGIAAAGAAGLGSTRGDLERATGALRGLRPDQLDQPLPDALVETSVRVFPTSGWNQCAYEAALGAARAAAGPPSAITVAVPEAVRTASTGPTPAERTADSLEWSVAAAVATVTDGRAADLVGLVAVGDRPAGAAVRVLGSHRPGEAAVPAPLDHPTRPADRDQLSAKWQLADPAARLATLADLLGSATTVEELR